MSISWVKAAVALPSTGRHLWVYTRRGAFMFGFYRLAPRPYDPNDVAWWNWP